MAVRRRRKVVIAAKDDPTMAYLRGKPRSRRRKLMRGILDLTFVPEATAPGVRKSIRNLIWRLQVRPARIRKRRRR